jgi:hypothetical protein
LYRFLGLGDSLLKSGTRSGANVPDPDSYAFDNLFENNFGEWQLGFQYDMPLGFRAERAQVRNTQLQLRRAEKRLEDAELAVTHQLSTAVRRLRDQYQIAQTQFNTLVGYRDQVRSAETAYEIAQNIQLNVVLDAQSRQAQAEIDYFRALTEYNLAIVEVHFRKGSLLEYNGIALAEGPWPTKAYFDAQTRARQRDASYYLNYGFSRPAVVSRGPVEQFMGTSTGKSTRAATASDAEVVEEIFAGDLPEVINPPTGEADPIYGTLGLEE